MTKQWYRATHKRIGGLIDIVELDRDDFERFLVDYVLEPMVVMTQAEFDAAIEAARQRGKMEMLEAVESYHEESY